VGGASAESSGGGEANSNLGCSHNEPGVIGQQIGAFLRTTRCIIQPRINQRWHKCVTMKLIVKSHRIGRTVDANRFIDFRFWRITFAIDLSKRTPNHDPKRTVFTSEGCIVESTFHYSPLCMSLRPSGTDSEGKNSGPSVHIWGVMSTFCGKSHLAGKLCIQLKSTTSGCRTRSLQAAVWRARISPDLGTSRFRRAR
jgi:hypothetical protein